MSFLKIIFVLLAVLIVCGIGFIVFTDANIVQKNEIVSISLDDATR